MKVKAKAKRYVASTELGWLETANVPTTFSLEKNVHLSCRPTLYGGFRVCF